MRVNWRSSKPKPMPLRKRKEAEALADHVRHVQARWFACLPDAEAALAEYEGQGPGHRGRRPVPGGITQSVSQRGSTRRTRRPRRGRPAKTDPPS